RALLPPCEPPEGSQKPTGGKCIKAVVTHNRHGPLRAVLPLAKSRKFLHTEPVESLRSAPGHDCNPSRPDKRADMSGRATGLLSVLGAFALATASPSVAEDGN